MDCVSCLEFLDSDFGCGFLVFGCFRLVFYVLGLFLLFGLGLKFLGFGWHYWGFSQILCVLGGVSSELRNGFSSKSGFNEKSNSKILSCKCGWLNSLMKSNRLVIEKLDGNKGWVEGSDDEHDDENEEFDGVKLRKMLKIERSRANAAYVELEKERMAAKTATEETMAMILRLQNEKSLVEMVANQYRRLAEEKQLHDQAVIQSLRWIVMKHESERSHLEDQVRLLKRKLKLYLKDDEGDQSEGVESVDESLSFLSANFEDALEDGLVSSLDMGLSPYFNQLDLAEYRYKTASNGETTAYSYA